MALVFYIFFLLFFFKNNYKVKKKKYQVDLIGVLMIFDIFVILYILFVHLF